MEAITSYIELISEKHQTNDIRSALRDAPWILSYKDFEMIANQNPVFSDIKYSVAKLTGISLVNLQNVSLYINNEKISESFEIEDNQIIVALGIANRGFLKQLIFNDCYGFIQITVSLDYGARGFVTLYSEYLAIYFKDNPDNQSLQKMIDYVYENHDRFLYDNKTKPNFNSELKIQTAPKNMDTTIKLLKHIIHSYETCLPAFQINAKTKIIEQGIVVNFEKVSQLKYPTITYIAQHPDELSPIDESLGIQINKSHFQPKKTLAFNNNLTMNIYENRVILAFLKLLSYYVSCLISELAKLISSAKKPIIKRDGYISSFSYIVSGTIIKCKNYLEQLNVIQNKLTNLFFSYKHIFCFDVNYSDYVGNILMPTQIFTSIPHYQRIFECIKKWYLYGDYNLEKEEFIIPFLVNYQLYEYYILLRILNAFNNNGWDLVDSSQFTYEAANSSWLYLNTNYNNTFVFNKDDQTITVYYQPVVYGQSFNKILYANYTNGINLYRNSSCLVADDDVTPKSSNCYYTPDYIIKYKKAENERYIILDAKFSKLRDIKANLQIYTFKYLFSLATASDNAKIAGLKLYCGKDYPGSPRDFDCHDITNELKQIPITPSTTISVITENGIQDYDTLIYESIRKTFLGENQNTP